MFFMPDIPMIEILLLFEKLTGKEKVVYLFPGSPGDQAMELFVTASGSTFVLYHLDAYYDDTLRQRRTTNNMLLPKTQERLKFVRNVWNRMPYNMQDYILLGRTTLDSKQILVDET
jgi:hypothetical protein